MTNRIDGMATEFQVHLSDTAGFDPLAEVTNILAAIPDRTRFLEALLVTARRSFLADHAAILSFHRPTGRWFLEASHGLTDDAIDEIKGLSWTVIRKVSSQAESLLILDTAEHELTRNSQSIRAYNILSVLCAPIQDSSGLWGTLYIDSSSVPRAFDNKSREQLQRFAEFAGIAIQRCEDIVRLTGPTVRAADGAAEPFWGFESARMIQSMAVLQRAAAVDVPVLLVGETGTGKDVFAHWVHQKSRRHQSPFVQVNCANIPYNLLESELFGIESGVASGVTFREGRIKLADGGTVFLNEIGELPLSMQVKILRVIEDKMLDRVGGNAPVGVDVRFICATNRDLNAAVESGRFRRDLYYRINVFETEIPPLRDRPEDIPLLAVHILDAKCRQYRRRPMRFPKTTMAQLAAMPWKGNIRELANIIERGVILSEDDEFHLDAVVSLPAAGTGPSPHGNHRISLPLLLDKIEREQIQRVLRESGWMMKHAASRLGVPLSTLRSKMKKHGINKPRRAK